MSKGSDLELLALLAGKVVDLRKAFKTLSKQQGPCGEAGETGPRGEAGVDGAAGPRGKTGLDGAAGPRGAAGQDGADGADGKDGVDGRTPDHEWSNYKLRFEKPGGHWGEWVDLRGPKGEKGPKGETGRTGMSGYGGSGASSTFDPSAMPLASAARPDAYIVMQGGVLVRASKTQMQQWLGFSDTGSVAVTVNGVAVTVNGQAVTTGS